MTTDNQREFLNVENCMTNNELGHILQMNWPARFFFGALIIIIWLFENIFKYVTYKVILKMKIWERPINIMIILNQVIDHIISSLVILNFSCMVPYATPSVVFLERCLTFQINSHTFCGTLAYLIFFWISYSNFSGLGMALYRVLLVTRPHLVRANIGSNNLLMFLVAGTLACCSLTTVWFGHGEAFGRTSVNSCQGVSETFQVML